MPINHVDRLIEAYLDKTLSPKALAQVEQHTNECRRCADRLYEAKRLRQELGPVLRVTLGQPSPPPKLQHEVKSALRKQQSTAWFRLSWTVPIRVLGTVGNMALVAALAFGAFVVIKGNIPGTSLFYAASPEVDPVLGSTNVQMVITPVLTVSQAVRETPFDTAISSDGRHSLGDTLRPFTVPDLSPQRDTAGGEVETFQKDSYPPVTPSQEYVAPRNVNEPQLPGGTIAYAIYDVTPGVEAYRTYFISPNGNNLRPYPLLDVSEPALHPNSENEYTLAVRTWEEKSNPRTMLTSNFSSDKRMAIGKYWEDAQADWSPVENRVIFASQRESDRNWRLYTAWGDGSREDNLLREGRSPTFAPDGRRFAFESCDKFGNRCGLWQGHLYDTGKDDYQLLIEDQRAKAPDWSPVDERIVYMANPDDNWDLYVTDSDGENLQRLTDDPAIDGLPAWSPDGEWVAFISNRADEWGIWLLHIESGELHQTVVFDNGYLTPEDRRPYNEHGKRYWWDEQISWSNN